MGLVVFCQGNEDGSKADEAASDDGNASAASMADLVMAAVQKTSPAIGGFLTDTYVPTEVDGSKGCLQFWTTST